ncbi:MAG TPA: hypothetical protein VGV38_20150 [Pyrinomonadaceae bacterium]|nr:hypothetical protein [Pyrinomonadaceae bacterium]
MKSFMTEYFLGCLWLAGMYAAAVIRFERGRLLLAFASSPLLLIALTVGLYLPWAADARDEIIFFPAFFSVIGLLLGGVFFLWAVTCREAERRRHLAVATLMLFGPSFLFPLTLAFRAIF